MRQQKQFDSCAEYVKNNTPNQPSSHKKKKKKTIQKLQKKKKNGKEKRENENSLLTVRSFSCLCMWLCVFYLWQLIFIILSKCNQEMLL